MNGMRKTLLVLWLFVLVAVCGAAEQAGFSVQVSVDWKAGALGVTVARSLSPAISATPRAQADAEAAIDSSFLGLLFGAISPVIFDSGHTMGDLLSSNAGFFSWMNSLGSAAVKDRLSLTPDFTTLVAHYTFPLFGNGGIGAPFYPAQDAPIPRRLGYVPTKAFTGLVVYAGDKLPSVGESGERYAAPALFPRLFDQDMNIVLDRSMVKPEILSKWGMVGYTDVIDDNEILLRAGREPLRIAARAVFGTNGTDLVISNEAAHQLLTLSENLEMLKEGKILVIYRSLK
jgi:hypothetical protein